MLFEQPVRIGDVIAVQSLTGVIVRIGGRSTWVRTYDDEVVIIPNSDLTNHQVVNWMEGLFRPGDQRKQVRNKQPREERVIMDDTNYGHFFYPHDCGRVYRCRGGHPQRRRS